MNDKDKEELYNFFHDLNNFLTVALGSIEVLVLNCTKNIEDQKALLKIAHLSIKKMISFVDEHSRLYLKENQKEESI